MPGTENRSGSPIRRRARTVRAATHPLAASPSEEIALCAREIRIGERKFEGLSPRRGRRRKRKCIPRRLGERRRKNRRRAGKGNASQFTCGKKAFGEAEAKTMTPAGLTQPEAGTFYASETEVTRCHGALSSPVDSVSASASVVRSLSPRFFKRARIPAIFPENFSFFRSDPVRKREFP